MKVSSLLPICCLFASFAIAVAGDARADQEVQVDINKFQQPSWNGIFGGWARCAGVPIPWNCTNADDEISYNLTANWSSGYAIADVVNFGQQVSAGDRAYSQISLYCNDGSFGDTFYPFGGGDAQDGAPPPARVYSSCPSGAYEAVFTYTVEAVTGS